MEVCDRGERAAGDEEERRLGRVLHDLLQAVVGECVGGGVDVVLALALEDLVVAILLVFDGHGEKVEKIWLYQLCCGSLEVASRGGDDRSGGGQSRGGGRDDMNMITTVWHGGRKYVQINRRLDAV